MLASGGFAGLNLAQYASPFIFRSRTGPKVRLVVMVPSMLPVRPDRMARAIGEVASSLAFVRFDAAPSGDSASAALGRPASTMEPASIGVLTSTWTRTMSPESATDHSGYAL